MKVIGNLKENGEIEVQNMYSDETQIIDIVENVPPQQPESTPIGKDMRLYYNQETGSLYWKAVDRPMTLEEENQMLKNKMELMQQALDEIIMGGAL